MCLQSNYLSLFLRLVGKIICVVFYSSQPNETTTVHNLNNMFSIPHVVHIKHNVSQPHTEHNIKYLVFIQHVQHAQHLVPCEIWMFLTVQKRTPCRRKLRCEIKQVILSPLTSHILFDLSLPIRTMIYPYMHLFILIIFILFLFDFPFILYFLYTFSNFCRTNLTQ